MQTMQKDRHFLRIIETLPICQLNHLHLHQGKKYAVLREGERAKIVGKLDRIMRDTLHKSSVTA